MNCLEGAISDRGFLIGVHIKHTCTHGHTDHHQQKTHHSA